MANREQPIARPTLTAISRDSPERWGLAHSDCSEISLYRTLALTATRESTTYIGSYTDGYSGIVYSGSYHDGYPSGSFERWRLAHSDCSELSLHRVPTLTATRLAAYIGSYSDGYSGTTYRGSYFDGCPSRSLLKDRGLLTVIARSLTYIGRPDGYLYRAP